MSPAPSFVRDCALALAPDHTWKLPRIIAFCLAYCRSEVREHGEYWAVCTAREAVIEIRGAYRRNRASAVSSPCRPKVRALPPARTVTPVVNSPGAGNGAGPFPL